MALKLLVVDDHLVVRQGLAHMLCGTPFEITHSVSSAAEALELLATVSFDVILLDVRMPQMDGLAALERISQICDTPVVIISVYENPTYVARAAALGARDYVSKNGCGRELIDALERLSRGKQPALESQLATIQKVMRRLGAPEELQTELPLTCRETQVLRHMALGLSNKEIASSLRISVETAKEHVRNILRKLQAIDRTDAAVRAVKMGLID